MSAPHSGHRPEVPKRFRAEAKRLKVGYQTLIHRVLAEHVGAHVA